MPNWNNVIHLYTKKDLNLSEPFEETIKLNVSVSARHNGTMQAYIVIVNNNFEGDDFDEVGLFSLFVLFVFQAEWMVKDTIPLTHYQIPKAETFNLISNEATNPVCIFFSFFSIFIALETVFQARFTSPISFACQFRDRISDFGCKKHSR